MIYFQFNSKSLIIENNCLLHLCILDNSLIHRHKSHESGRDTNVIVRKSKYHVNSKPFQAHKCSIRPRVNWNGSLILYHLCSHVIYSSKVSHCCDHHPHWSKGSYTRRNVEFYDYKYMAQIVQKLARNHCY